MCECFALEKNCRITYFMAYHKKAARLSVGDVPIIARAELNVLLADLHLVLEAYSNSCPLA